jgi:hypothetical protein
MDGGHGIPTAPSSIVRAYKPIEPANSPITTGITRLGLHATVIHKKVVASAAIGISIIGFCIFDFDIGHIAIAFIFGIIGLGMIRGT